jgi:hypothetical protein
MHHKLTRVPLFILSVLAMIALAGVVFMSLWNALLPELFHAPVLTFWQSLGLLLLSKLLFGGMHPMRNFRYANHQRWHRKLDAKLNEIDPNDREAFKEFWKEYYCSHRGFWSRGRYAAGDEPKQEQENK